jgi:peroxiredoxin
VEVAYRPAATLSGEPRLRLPARLRTAKDPEYPRTIGSSAVATLTPDGEGIYRGTFSLPDSVVYAVLAVEDTAASATDSREGRFWELVVHDSADRPLFEALEQRFLDHMGRDHRAVLETAREIVRVHPDRVRGWILLDAAEGWVLGDGREEERRASHRERLARFDSVLAERERPDVEQVASMARYADRYGGEEVSGRWRQRWRELWGARPEHPLVVRARATHLFRKHGERPEVLLRELGKLWQVTEDREARRLVADVGFRAARTLGEREPLLRWSERYRAYPPGIVGTPRINTMETLLSNEATRTRALALAEAEIERLRRAPDDERRLGETRAGHRRRSSRLAARLRVAVGEARLVEGRTSEGLAALERAAAVGWETDRFRTLGEARLEAGDREGATGAMAAVAADPGTSEETADSLRRHLGVEREAWDRAVRKAEAEMMKRTLAEDRKEPTGSPEAVTPDGSRVRLDDRLGKEATVVVIWSRYCGPSRHAMPRVVELSEELAADDVPVVAVTGDAPEEAKAYLREEDLDLEVLFDVEGQVARAVNSWGTPQYFVLDGEGRLRFVSSLEDAPRHVAVLRAADGGARADDASGPGIANDP